MKRVLTSAAMTTLLASGALAGGVERSQQSVGLLFEDGDYAEFSLSFVDPTASGLLLGPPMKAAIWLRAIRPCGLATRWT